MQITRRFVDVSPDGTVKSDRTSTADESVWAKWDAAYPELPPETKDVTEHPHAGPLNGYRFKSQSGKTVVFDPPLAVVVVATESLEAKIDRLILAVDALTTAVNTGKP